MRNNFWCKILVLIMALLVIMTLVACSNDEVPSTTVGTEAESTEPQSTQGSTATTQTETGDITSESENRDTTDSSETVEDTSSDSETTEAPGSSETSENTTLTEGDPLIPVDSEVDTEKKQETEEPEIVGCHPRFDWDSGYHWTPACEITTGMHQNPIKAGKKTPHTAMCTIEDEGDVLVYTYTCVRCMYTIKRVEIPYSVAMYIDAIELTECKHDFNEVGGSEFTSVDGIPAARYTALEGKGSYIKIYEDENTSIPTGRYLAIKIKLRAGRSAFNFGVSSIEGKKAGNGISVDISGLNSGWSAVIVDMSKLTDGKRGFVPDANGDYYLYSASINLVGKSALSVDDYLDVAFAAFFDDIDDARALFANENAIYVYEDALTNPFPVIEGNPCKHQYTYPDENHHASDPCDVCFDEGGTESHSFDFISVKDDVAKTTEYMLKCPCGIATDPIVVSDKINYFSAPGQVYNNWASFSGTKNNGGSCAPTGQIMTENGLVFTRIGLNDGASFEFTNGTNIPAVRGFGAGHTLNNANGLDAGDVISGGSGKYIVMKIRCGGVDQLRLIVNDGNHNEIFHSGANNFQWHGRSSKEIVQYDWTTYVIDIETLNSPYYTVNDESVTNVAFGLHFQNVGLTSTTDVIEYVDVAYFAVCDDWNEVVSLTGDEKLLYTNWVNPGADVLRNPDGSCVECGITLLEAKNGTYKYGCPGCKTVLKTLTDPDVNYYSAPSYYYNNWNSGLSSYGSCVSVGNLKFDEDGQFIYSSITMYQGASFEFTNGSITPSRGYGVNGLRENGETVIDPGDTIVGGSGAYFVIKMRTTDIEYIDLILNGDDDEGGVASTSSARRSSKDIFDDEWTVYVIDIEKLAAEHYVANNSDVTNICVGMKIDEGTFDPSTGGGWGGTEVMDIAYFAVCNDWDAVESVVGDEKVLYTDWKTTNNDKILNSDGSDVCQHDFGDYERDEINHWQDACSSCGEVIAAKPHNWKYMKEARVCMTCGLRETCDGDHYELDESGHRIKETCLVCKLYEQDEQVAHDWKYGKKSRACVACGYSETCSSDHYTHDANGHIVKEDCAICQLTQTTTSAAHEWSYGIKNRQCLVCLYIESCDKDHIVFDAMGHKVNETCDICQVTAQNAMTAHSEDKTISVVRGETHTTYTLGCAVCGYGNDKWTVPNGVNFYSIPGLQVNNWNAGEGTAQGAYIYNIDRYTGDNTSFLYNRIMFSTTGSVKLSNGSAEPTRFMSLTDRIDGSGRYAVMKIRVGGESIGWLSFGSYDGSGNPADSDAVFRRNNSPNLRGTNKLAIGEWVTYVVDLTGIDSTYYKANDPTLTHASFGFQIMIGKGGTATDYVDIAYFAICDDMTEVGHVVGDDDVEYLKNWGGNGVSMSCHKGNHSYAQGSNKCSICEYERVCLDPMSHYEITSTGHRIVEDCEVCGVTAQTTETPHTITTLDTEKGTDVTTYTYKCDVCSSVVRTWNVSNDVNYYSAPTQTYNNWATNGNGGACVQTGTMSSDGTYNRIQIGNGASFEFVNGSITPVRSFGVDQTVKSKYDAGDTINGGSGRYFVLRYKVHGPQILKLVVNSNKHSTVPNLESNVTELLVTRTVAETQDVWRTVVIDIAALDSSYYPAEDDEVTNIAVGLYFEAASNLSTIPESERYIDIAYFAVCDNMTEVASVVGNDTVEFLANFKNGNAVTTTCHKGQHSIAEGQTKCSVCGE